MYQHNRSVQAMIGGTTAISRSLYLRIFAIACIVLTLSTFSTLWLAIPLLSNKIFLWPGWSIIHQDWKPLSIPFDDWHSNFWERLEYTWHTLINAIIGILLFVLVGTTSDARRAYTVTFHTNLSWLKCLWIKQREHSTNAEAELPATSPNLPGSQVMLLSNRDLYVFPCFEFTCMPEHDYRRSIPYRTPSNTSSTGHYLQSSIVNFEGQLFSQSILRQEV
jgi:hypothetical protein